MRELQRDKGNEQPHVVIDRRRQQEHHTEDEHQVRDPAVRDEELAAVEHVPGDHAAVDAEHEDALAGQPQVTTLLRGTSAGCQGAPALFKTTGAAFLANHAMSAEIFGPASLVVACRDLDELLAVIEGLEGQLTATLQLQDEDEADLAAARHLLPALERKVGRILANGFPTGVEVSTAMVHGGPFPATSDGRSSSVGTAAIQRFLRPVCYQDIPAALLPIDLA